MFLFDSVLVKKMTDQNVFLYNYSLNQDQSCFSISTSADFRTFTLSPALSEVSRRRINADSRDVMSAPSPVNVTTMLFQTNYLALVSRSNPYKVLLWDDSLGQAPHEMWSRFEVLNVVLRRDVICIVSEYKIYVYEFGGNFQVLLHLETVSNPKGLCAVSVGSPTAWTLVCPGASRGNVRIQRGLDDSISSSVVAHSNSLAALAVNQNGTIAASASESGTVVKLFSAQDGQLLYEFRRGTSSVIISSLSFRLDSKFLLVGSASQTVHIFKLDEGKTATTTMATSTSSVVSSVLGRVVEYTSGISSPADHSNILARSSALIPKYFQSCRAFALFKIPDTGGDLRVSASPIAGPLCCFSKQTPNKFFVIHYNGLIYQGSFDDSRTELGQEASFLGAHAFFQSRPEFVVQQTDLVTDKSDDINDVWHVI